jgi:hypothetical protein
MMAFGLTRFVLKGWVEKVLVEPTYFFKLPGFAWTVVGDPPVLYAHFAVTALAAGFVSLGLFYRWAIAVFWLGFTYLQLLDVTLYLNHYYLVVLLAGLLAVMPAHRMWSVDAWRRPRLARATTPAWTYAVLRLQLAVVYFFAGLAKAHPDWLLHGQPLGLWMRARTEIPLLGPLLDEPWVALGMSWFGFAYDLTIWVFLLLPPTRKVAYVLVVGFHVLTGVFFEIGMFPVIMIVSTTLFFHPSWPRRWVGLLARAGRGPPRGGRAPAAGRPLPRWGLALLSAYALVQVGVPLRHYALPGDVLWNERGMRFAWKVMVREKNGAITYRVRLPEGREVQVSPFDYLTWRQLSDMSGQPDLILALGKHIAGDFARRGRGAVEVRVDAFVSLNGRRPARLVDPTVDVTKITRADLGSWVLPGPVSPPAPLGIAGRALSRR